MYTRWKTCFMWSSDYRTFLELKISTDLAYMRTNCKIQGDYFSYNIYEVK